MAGKKQLPLSGTVTIPMSGGRDESSSVVRSLPDSDVPATFSLPPNADRVVQRTRVAQVLTDLFKLQEVKEVSKMSKEEWALLLQPILQQWLQLCQPHADLLTHGQAAKKDPRPVEGFLATEMVSAISLIAKVEQTMSELRKVIEGTMLLSERLRLESNCMLAGTVPPTWDGYFSGPELLVPWMSALVSKTAAIRNWNQAAQEGSLLRSPLDLSDLFRPQTFLNALRQETAHVTREPLVSLQLACSVGKPVPSAALCVKLDNMLLQGASMDESGVLAQVNSADAAGCAMLHDVYIAWVMNATVDASAVAIPVYANGTKETLLWELKLRCPSAADVNKFILAGVAIILEL